ncbi:MAG: hypothetical protein AAF585_08740 [Verrucomicrobiota bacterium]
MPRRASSGISVGQIFGLLAGIVFILVFAVAIFFLLSGGLGGGGEGPRTSADRDLIVNEYLENANALRGNAYNVSGKIQEQLKWTPDRGRLISLEVSDASGSAPLPIHVPSEFNNVNIEAGAEFTFVVEVKANGILVVTSVN